MTLKITNHSFPNSEKAQWDAEDINRLIAVSYMKTNSAMKLLYLSREKWEYASGHVFARDIVVIEKVS